ncbi:hypothetical protein TEA_007083 [Camellia sinensis var. sinensis]|uniref:FAS1 domain-containing protein n=1 Tax=Camellia sinensis var. sinensis TaxID=542762 RepID=A0A4S4D0E3_CAMSN|nr:hypothetical protein TEA_007083 [Camellia sinensis var. sinensis]
MGNGKVILNSDSIVEEHKLKPSGLPFLQLRDWLDLSLNYSVPFSLLILSRAFIVSGKVKPEEAIQATLSSLPDEVVDIVGVTTLTLRSTTFQLAGNTVQYPMNVTTAGNLVNIRTGIVNTTVTGTVYSDNQLAVYQVDRVLLPLSFFVSISPALVPSKPVKKAPSPVSDESASSTDASVQASDVVPHRALNVVVCFAGLVIARVHSFRCCSNNNNNNNNKPKPTQTPQLLKIAVTGLTELLRLFSSGQDRMDIVNDVQRYEVSVSSIDDVVMILNSDYENAYFVTVSNGERERETKKKKQKTTPDEKKKKAPAKHKA